MKFLLRSTDVLHSTHFRNLHVRHLEIALRILWISQSKSIYIVETEGFSLKLMVLADNIYLYTRLHHYGRPSMTLVIGGPSKHDPLDTLADQLS